jgi:hypothetical protein
MLPLRTCLRKKYIVIVAYAAESNTNTLNIVEYEYSEHDGEPSNHLVLFVLRKRCRLFTSTDNLFCQQSETPVLTNDDEERH